MLHLRRCLAAVLLLQLAAQCQAVTLSCLELTQLNASAPEGVQACCTEQWYTSYAGINGSIPKGSKRLYCGSPANRDVDYSLARSNTSWYEYCLDMPCPLEDGDVEICCVTDTPAANTTTIATSPTYSYSYPSPAPIPSPSPSPSPAAKPAGDKLWLQYGAIWAVYMCPRTAPSTSLFGHALKPPTDTPATATAKAAPLNLTTAPASKLLAACPSVPDGTSPPALDVTFNFSASSALTSAAGIIAAKPYMLSFFRKPSLGAVKITLSVQLMDDKQSNPLLYDRVTVTLEAPAPSAVGAVPSWTGMEARRKLLGSFASETRWHPNEEEVEEERGCQAAVGGASGARRRLHRGSGGGGGGHGGGGGGSRGRGSSSSSKYAGYSISGRQAYSNMTLDSSTLYRGSAFPGVQFAQYYAYKEPGLSSSSSSSKPERTKVPFAVPALYQYSYVVNTSVVNTTYGFYGPSVFRANATFQYISDTRWPAPKGAPECTICPNTTACCSSGLSCCQGGRNGDPENSNWLYRYMQPNRRATLLSCGLIQDFITTFPIYFPIGATDLRVTIHSIEAAATTAAPACGDTAATLDPRDPPLYLTVLQADEVDVWQAPSRRRSSGSYAAAPTTLLGLVLAVLAMLLSA